MAGGGGKLEIINSRERAVSQDINRLQAFAAYDRAEIFRRLLDCRGNFIGGGVEELGSFIDTSVEDAAPITSPVTADVIEGLVVLPQPGSLNLLVSPGCVFLNDPDGQAGSSDPNPPNPDDSRLKLVVDPGVQLVGTLVLGAGAGSTRIDVVECQRTTSIIETDSRDIFDPSTGLFSAVAVTKVIEGRLVYRIRAGTPGAGLPANAQGWLPLAVVSVPASAPNVDVCTFWDVRPLVKDRFSGVGGSQMANATFDGANQILGDDVTDGTKTLLLGYSTSQIGMYRAGGLNAGINTGFDIRDVANQSAGYTPIAGRPWYLYAIFPGSLPRWVKYADFPVSRVPLGPVGILALSAIQPTLEEGIAFFNSIAAPLATGLLSSGPAVMLATGLCNAGPNPCAIVMQDGLCRFTALSSKLIAVAASTATTDTYTFTVGIDFPKNAKSLLVIFAATFNADCQISTSVDILKPTTGTVINTVQTGSSFTKNGSVASVVAEVPIPQFETRLGYATGDLHVTFNWAQSGGTKSAPIAILIGVRI